MSWDQVNWKEMTVRELADYIVWVHACRAEIKAARAAGKKIIEGSAPGYLHNLLRFVYNEYLEFHLQDDFLKPGENLIEKIGAFPEERILENLFKLFLQNMEEKEVRELFAAFGPKSPRTESKERERELLRLFLESNGNKAQFAQKVAEYNATAPLEERLGSRSTSQANILRDLERAIRPHGEELKRRISQLRKMPRDAWELRVLGSARPMVGGRHFRRKMSRQT
jgi:hypothetical protein